MPVPSRRLKELIEGTVDHHASQRWPALEEVTISWRGSYGYLTGYLSEDDDDTIKLCRIQYLGDDDEWAFAIWQASTDSYTDSVLLDGRPAGHPSLALDTACTLYLTDTGDKPPDPLTELRGAALVAHQLNRSSSSLHAQLPAKRFRPSSPAAHERRLHPSASIGPDTSFTRMRTRPEVVSWWPAGSPPR